MKILLLGDFSSLFSNLKPGLERLGHDVKLASRSDGWKNIPRDIDLGDDTTLLKNIFSRINTVRNRNLFEGYDVVQMINPFYFHLPYFFNKILVDHIAQNNQSFHLTAAGDDSFFWDNARNLMRYGPFEDYLKYDLKRANCKFTKPHYYSFNKYVVSKVRSVIPVMYEYYLAYHDCNKRADTIPIPINVDKIAFSENKHSNRITVFHGLNRYGFKGTRHVERAFEVLKQKYPNDLELVIAGGLPLPEYLSLMARTNVVIDQVNSYSMGVNGLYAMAMGKVVIGGAEKESYEHIGATSSPALNITPDYKSIISAVEFILENRKSIPDMSFESRRYIEINHNYVEIAKKYITAWHKS